MDTCKNGEWVYLGLKFLKSLLWKQISLFLFGEKISSLTVSSWHGSYLWNFKREDLKDFVYQVHDIGYLSLFFKTKSLILSVFCWLFFYDCVLWWRQNRVLVPLCVSTWTKCDTNKKFTYFSGRKIAFLDLKLVKFPGNVTLTMGNNLG